MRDVRKLILTILVIPLFVFGSLSLDVFAVDEPVASKPEKGDITGYSNEEDQWSDPWGDWGTEFYYPRSIFRRMLNEFGPPPRLREHDFMPSMDVIQTKDEYVIQMDLPGMEKDEINVQVKDDILTVSGTREDKWSFMDEKKGTYLRRTSRKYGHFSKIIKLPEGITAKDINASYDNGVLEIVVKYKKKIEEKTKQIKIE
ncbi:MAG: Hsp20 family protein [Candidatus Omnitrophica bacterium]|nr:Hsp20 family protein [Candidatus Omnitrophota bacterium]